MRGILYVCSGIVKVRPTAAAMSSSSSAGGPFVVAGRSRTLHCPIGILG
jgi:hypothetical protein